LIGEVCRERSGGRYRVWGRGVEREKVGVEGGLWGIMRRVEFE